MGREWAYIIDTDAQEVRPIVLAPGQAAGLCRHPYPGHPLGCPNFGRKLGCPPYAKPLAEVLDLAAPIWVVWTAFDLARRKAELAATHPNWSPRQLVNPRYWQGMARKALRWKVEYFAYRINLQLAQPFATALFCPEAHGVDITATMASIGQCLQWPPRTVTYQVALIGFPQMPA
jgi:hypothetical protein